MTDAPFVVYVWCARVVVRCLNGTEWNGTERNGMERNGTERNGTERNGMERNGTEWNGTERNGTKWNGTETGNGIEWTRDESPVHADILSSASSGRGPGALCVHMYVLAGVTATVRRKMPHAAAGEGRLTQPMLERLLVSKQLNT